MLRFLQGPPRRGSYAFAGFAAAWLGAVSTFSGAEASDYRIIRLINGIDRPDLPCCVDFRLWPTPVIEGDRVAFLSRSGGPPDGVWIGNITTRQLTKLVGPDTPVPGGSGNFSAFNGDPDKRLTIGGGRIAFFGTDQGGVLGLFVVSVNGGPIARIATIGGAAPGGGNFTQLAFASLNNNFITFKGTTSTTTGVYRATVSGANLVNLRDTNDHLDARTPSGTADDYFNLYTRPLMLTGNDIAFYASGLFDPVTGPSAIFSFPNVRLADNMTALAGAPDDSHVRIIDLSTGIGTGRVAFHADQPNNGFQGLFRTTGPNSAPSFVTNNTPVPGTTREFSSFGGFGYDASGVAFTGFSPLPSGTENSVNFVAGLGAPVIRIAASPEYFLPVVGDRSLSQGRIAFMENSNFADTIYVAVPGNAGDLLADFGPQGLHRQLNNGAFAQVHAISPIAIAAGDLDGNLIDEAIASFANQGLRARYNNAGGWQLLHAAAPTHIVAGDFDGDGRDDLAGDFPGSGILVRVNNGAWVARHANVSQGLAVGDLDGNGRDELIADRGGGGLWARYNNANPWVQLNTVNPLRVITADLDGSGRDEVIADRPSGTWARYNNAGPWVQLHNVPSEGLAAGDLDGDGRDDLLADRGASGLWVRYNNAGAWQQLSPLNPFDVITADLDSSGEAEVITDRGGGGLWARYNNAGPWQQLSPLNPEGLAAGDLD